MFKPVLAAADGIATPRQAPAPQGDANSVFRVLHGFYGNLFLSRFATGEVLPDGGDGGVASARGIWAHGLREFTSEVIKTALARTLDTHEQYPPTLPQFVALCRACAPRKAFQATLPAPAADRAEHAQKAREFLGCLKTEGPPPGGLELLNQAIADAVRCAGGDEAAALARFEREMAVTN